MGRLIDKAVSSIRGKWYDATEPLMLRALRRRYDDESWSERGLVSVYIPTHNRADLLMARGLRSVLGQTYRHIEVIVAAHDCTDDTVERVRSLQDPRVRVIEVPRRHRFPRTPENYWFAGRVEPANAALKECNRSWIATNDDDDIWEPRHLERLLDFAQEGNYEFVSGQSTRGRPKTLVAPYKVGGFTSVGGVQTWLYRSYLKSFRFNPECWRKEWNAVCDTDLQARFHKAGVRMGYLRQIVTHIEVRPGETETGLKAYQADPQKTLRHFA